MFVFRMRDLDNCPWVISTARRSLRTCPSAPSVLRSGSRDAPQDSAYVVLGRLIVGVVSYPSVKGV